MKRTKDAILTVLKVGISLGLIAYLLFGVDFEQVGQAFARASGHADLLLLALVLYCAAVVASSFKWQLLLRAQQLRLPFARVLSFSLVGLFFGNFLLPVIAGDVARGFDLARNTERPALAAVSVLVDKLLGLLAFITAAAIMSVYALWGLGRWDLQTVAVPVFLGFAFFVLLFCSLMSRRIRVLVERLFSVRALARLAPAYRQLSDGMQAYRSNPRVLMQSFGVSIGILFLTCAVNWLLAQTVDANVPFVYVLLFNPMIAFAPLILPSVGGLGVNQGAFDLFYARLGGTTTRELAVSFSLLMQLVVYVTSLPGGFLWLRKRRPAASAPVQPELPEAAHGH
jgi:glycosyltransferase 2 family protein